nr:hypothetical protein BaRGS_007490 [Batillaria attramentaria]
MTHLRVKLKVVGFKLRCVIITTVYRKALTVSSVAQAKFNTGEIVNFMSTDTDRIVNFCPSFHSFWSLPFQVAVSLYLLYEQVGVSFLAGLGFAIILIPINRQLAIKIGQLSTRMMEQKDSRVKLMNEMLCGIRVLKFYAWEDHFTERINELRSKELHSLKGRKYLDAMCVYFWATTPVLISILTFTTYVLLGNKLTAAKVGHMLVLQGGDTSRPHGSLELSGIDVEIKQWMYVCLHLPCSLWDIVPCYIIIQGQLVGVIGRVGCGKTSLLNALLAEMGRVRGSVSVQGLEEGFALAAQESWIQNATLCDNILFHQPYDSTRYEAVVWACALTDDLKHCIMGLLRNKTRILCTHNVRFLAQADVVLFMEDGRIVEAGPPSQVLPAVRIDRDVNAEDESSPVDESPEGEEDGGVMEEEERGKGVAPVSFFDTTPIGRIINRFSSDLYAIDDSLPFQLNIFLAQIFGILGLVGLAITYSLSVTNLLGGVVMFFTETEKQLPPSLWPKEGVVRYDRVHMRYRPGLPDALNGISFETQPGEKLGIVGRTGSGKSSLFLTLFRMVEIYDGEISVDGMNLKLLDLKDIRSHFAIIPQDPFLFSGSVRFNLDPTGCHCDDDLWAVLARCHLGEVVEMMGGLETDVGERGRHFSLGQRQLVCLARALLTKAKVLCIDEATASVDHETDSQVQMTIRSEFASSTVLTIAHRINTVMDSHRVLVMADGNVAELAPPAELLQNPQSQFYRLAHSSL